jgi:hypothetical protein
MSLRSDLVSAGYGFDTATSAQLTGMAVALALTNSESTTYDDGAATDEPTTGVTTDPTVDGTDTTDPGTPDPGATPDATATPGPTQTDATDPSGDAAADGSNGATDTSTVDTALSAEAQNTMAVLTMNGYLRNDHAPERTADVVVFLVGTLPGADASPDPSASPTSSPSPTPNTTAAALMAELAFGSAHLSNVVVVGPTMNDGDVLSELRRHSSWNAALSTVSGFETPVGQIVAPLAVATRLQGNVGQYGPESNASLLPKFDRALAAEQLLARDATATPTPDATGASPDSTATDGADSQPTPTP